MVSGASLIYLGICYGVGCYAEENRRSKWLWILVSLFTTPLLAFIVLLFLGKK